MAAATLTPAADRAAVVAFTATYDEEGSAVLFPKAKDGSVPFTKIFKPLHHEQVCFVVQDDRSPKHLLQLVFCDSRFTRGQRPQFMHKGCLLENLNVQETVELFCFQRNGHFYVMSVILCRVWAAVAGSLVAVGIFAFVVNSLWHMFNTKPATSCKTNHWRHLSDNLMQAFAILGEQGIVCRYHHAAEHLRSLSSMPSSTYMSHKVRHVCQQKD